VAVAVAVVVVVVVVADAEKAARATWTSSAARRRKTTFPSETAFTERHRTEIGVRYHLRNRYLTPIRFARSEPA
jgi:hypothetical protein